MHAVARLAFGAALPNIQASWVKMGPERAAALLSSGCNDMGGSIMNESITRAAGVHTPFRSGQFLLSAIPWSAGGRTRTTDPLGQPALSRAVVHFCNCMRLQSLGEEEV